MSVFFVESHKMRTHALAMRRVGLVLLLSSIVVGTGAPSLSKWLGFLSAAALAGVVVSIDMLLRSYRALRHTERLELSIFERRLSAQYVGKVAHLSNVSLLSAQAFPDHIRLIAGDPTRNQFYQVEVPVEGSSRESLIKDLSENGIAVSSRPALGVFLAQCFVLVPLAAALILLVYRIALRVALAGLVEGLKAVAPEAALPLFFLIAFVFGLVALRGRIRS